MTSVAVVWFGYRYGTEFPRAVWACVFVDVVFTLLGAPHDIAWLLGLYQ
jgi:hypothetical protein